MPASGLPPFVRPEASDWSAPLRLLRALCPSLGRPSYSSGTHRVGCHVGSLGDRGRGKLACWVKSVVRPAPLQQRNGCSGRRRERLNCGQLCRRGRWDRGWPGAVMPRRSSPGSRVGRPRIEACSGRCRWKRRRRERDGRGRRGRRAAAGGALSGDPPIPSFCSRGMMSEVSKLRLAITLPPSMLSRGRVLPQTAG